MVIASKGITNINCVSSVSSRQTATCQHDAWKRKLFAILQFSVVDNDEKVKVSITPWPEVSDELPQTMPLLP